MATVLPPSPVTAGQREVAAIVNEMGLLAARLREGEAYDLRILANRLQRQLERDVAALEYSDAALDRAIAAYRAHRDSWSLTPRALMDRVLAAARGRVECGMACVHQWTAHAPGAPPSESLPQLEHSYCSKCGTAYAERGA
jgi:hypothetical protein